MLSSPPVSSPSGSCSRSSSLPRRTSRGSAKIFYIHVPIALTAYFCFGLGALKALLLLWRGGERYDLESYVAIHQGTIFGSLADHRLALGKDVVGRVVELGLGPARALPRALPLLLRLLHAPVLASGEAAPGRSSAVYALFGVVLIPVSFLAIRLANDLVHPTVFTREGPQMTATMFTAFCVMWAAVTLLAYVLYRVELAGKRTDINLRELREALS